MARANVGAPASRSTTGELYRDRTPTSSPGAPFSSDKENRPHSRPRTSKAMGKQRKLATPSSNESGSPHGAKRRRTSNSNAKGTEEMDDLGKKYYDPEQDPEVRRKLRLALRQNDREITDTRDDLINGDSRNLVSLIKKQNHLMNEVRQTSDATIDSRFLVRASDIALKRAERLAYGDGSIGIDVDEFVSKCITFMRHGNSGHGNSDAAPTQSTQSRRRRTQAADEDDEDAGDALAWDVLGASACFPNNKRPGLPAFLLGPMSVQKRVRAATQRTQRSQAAAVTKPQELKAADLEKSETTNLTVQCKKIRSLLGNVIEKGMAGVEQEASEDMDEEEARSVFRRNHLAMNYEVSLFEFAVNPRSFGQTVENLFYISFLIKDGYFKLSMDDDGLPTLRPSEPRKAGDGGEGGDGAAKHQAIFSVNYGTWQKLIRALDIQVSLIPHRASEGTAMNSHGWYG
ncbi:Nse4-domain-containing protein [Trichodelitschia bisporula]|uniref:Non-structural maintenance of chromosomes element 4 n=1 Tax=Trichodelitschia bisporula TaxID=703511 RepID=A0A6G1HXM0_9PEZI|nr:Nse4-domain-containing protein [Trichodelitschia bisporula]